MPFWRLILDPPRSFAIELGTQKVVHCGDFRPDPMHTTLKTWREPCTSLMMLAPSVTDPDFAKDFKPLNQWAKSDDFWREVHRAAQAPDTSTAPTPPAPQPAQMMTLIKPAAKPFTLAAIAVGIADFVIDRIAYDDLSWVMQSNFTLAADEGFVWHYHAISDEMFRKKNWFALQWDNIGIHFSQKGSVRVMRYPDRANLMAAPTQVDEFLITSPGEQLNRPGYFWFIPIPGYGLAMYHSVVSQSTSVYFTSAQNTTFKPHLIPWPTTKDPDSGFQSLFAASKLTLGMNPYHPATVGFQNITYPTSGTWQDGGFDPGYVPSAAPASSTPILLPTGRGAATVAVKGPDGKADWKPGTDRIAKLETTLTTTDKRYTPFQTGYGVQWDPVFATRPTIPLLLSYVSPGDKGDRLTRLEWTDNSRGEFEGTATFLASSPALKHIVLRGDATWQMEYSPDAGANWYVVNGGLAKEFDVKLTQALGWGAYFECKCKLFDVWERLDETHKLWQTSLDSESIATAINNILTCSGFTPISNADFPASALTTMLQTLADGHTWRYGPRPADKSRHILHMLLLYLREQNLEYRARFDWAAATWRIEGRARKLDAGWKLVANSELKSENQRTWPLSHFSFKPVPPEANVTFVDGLSSNDPATAKRIPSGPITNRDSLTNLDSFDYLGRQVIELLLIPEVTDLDTINKMNRRVFDAIAHQRFKATAETDWFTWGLAPDVHCLVVDSEDNGVCIAWIKQRTVVIENADQEVMKFELDTVWENELDA